MAASALTTATAAALTSTLPDNAPKSNQQSPRNAPTVSTVAVHTGAFPFDVPNALKEGEKFIKWDEVSFFWLKKFVFFGASLGTVKNVQNLWYNH
jgi:hypothetical protein